MSDWDPFKPIDWNKDKKSSSSFFEPVNLYGSGDTTNTWGSPSSSTEKKDTTWGWSEPSNAQSNSHFSPVSFSNTTSQSAFSAGWGSPAQNNNSMWGGADQNQNKSSWGWSSGDSNLASDALRFGSESQLNRLKERYDAFSNTSQNDWGSADTNWHFSNVNHKLELSSTISKLEDGLRSGGNGSSWHWGTPAAPAASGNSSWGWSTESNSSNSGSSWGWEPSADFFSPTKLKRW